MSLFKFHQKILNFNYFYFIFTGFNKWISIMSIFLNCLFQYFKAQNYVFKSILPFQLKYFLCFPAKIEFKSLNLLEFLADFWFEVTFLENLYLLKWDHLSNLLFSYLFFVSLNHYPLLFISESILIRLFETAFLHETVFVSIQSLFQTTFKLY